LLASDLSKYKASAEDDFDFMKMLSGLDGADGEDGNGGGEN